MGNIKFSSSLHKLCEYRITGMAKRIFLPVQIRESILPQIFDITSIDLGHTFSIVHEYSSIE